MLVGEADHCPLRSRDPLAAQLDHLAIGHAVGPETASNPFPCLQNQHVEAAIG